MNNELAKAFNLVSTSTKAAKVVTKPEIPNANERWKIWNLPELFRYRIYPSQVYVTNEQDTEKGLGMYLPKLKDVVFIEEMGWFTVEEVDQEAELGATLKLWTATEVAGDDDDDRVIMGGGVSYLWSDQLVCTIDQSVSPMKMNVDNRIQIHGSKAKCAKVFFGTDYSKNGVQVSCLYNNSGDLLDPDDGIPLELLAMPKYENKAIKRVVDCNCNRIMENGELVTLVVYDEEGGIIPPVYPMVVQNSAFARLEETGTKYVTSIQLLNPFISNQDNMLIELPINVYLDGMEVRGRVWYSDGSHKDWPIDGGRMSLIGMKEYIPTVIGQQADMVLSYKLGEKEACFLANPGEHHHMTLRYRVRTVEAVGAYTVKLYGYPNWVDNLTGWRMEWWLYNLDRQRSYRVTDYVETAINSPAFDGKKFGVLQHMKYAITLSKVDSRFKAYRHVQHVDITLYQNGLQDGTKWTIGYDPGQDPVYGTDLDAKVGYVRPGDSVMRIDNGYKTYEEWLDALYYNIRPLKSNASEPKAPEPNFFELYINESMKYRFAVNQWNKDLPIDSSLVEGSVVFIKWINWDHDNTELQLGVSGLTVNHTNIDPTPPDPEPPTDKINLLALIGDYAPDANEIQLWSDSERYTFYRGAAGMNTLMFTDSTMGYGHFILTNLADRAKNAGDSESSSQIISIRDTLQEYVDNGWIDVSTDRSMVGNSYRYRVTFTATSEYAPIMNYFTITYPMTTTKTVILGPSLEDDDPIFSSLSNNVLDAKLQDWTKKENGNDFGWLTLAISATIAASSTAKLNPLFTVERATNYAIYKTTDSFFSKYTISQRLSGDTPPPDPAEITIDLDKLIGVYVPTKAEMDTWSLNDKITFYKGAAGVGIRDISDAFYVLVFNKCIDRAKKNNLPDDADKLTKLRDYSYNFAVNGQTTISPNNEIVSGQFKHFIDTIVNSVYQKMTVINSFSVVWPTTMEQTIGLLPQIDDTHPALVEDPTSEGLEALLSGWVSQTGNDYGYLTAAIVALLMSPAANKLGSKFTFVADDDKEIVTYTSTDDYFKTFVFNQAYKALINEKEFDLDKLIGTYSPDDDINNWNIQDRLDYFRLLSYTDPGAAPLDVKTDFAKVIFEKVAISVEDTDKDRAADLRYLRDQSAYLFNSSRMNYELVKDGDVPYGIRFKAMGIANNTLKNSGIVSVKLTDQTYWTLDPTITETSGVLDSPTPAQMEQLFTGWVTSNSDQAVIASTVIALLKGDTTTSALKPNFIATVHTDDRHVIYQSQSPDFTSYLIYQKFTWQTTNRTIYDFSSLVGDMELSDTEIAGLSSTDKYDYFIYLGNRDVVTYSTDNLWAYIKLILKVALSRKQVSGATKEIDALTWLTSDKFESYVLTGKFTFTPVLNRVVNSAGLSVSTSFSIVDNTSDNTRAYQGEFGLHYTPTVIKDINLKPTVTDADNVLTPSSSEFNTIINNWIKDENNSSETLTLAIDGLVAITSGVGNMTLEPQYSGAISDDKTKVIYTSTVSEYADVSMTQDYEKPAVVVVEYDLDDLVGNLKLSATEILNWEE